MEIHFRTVCGKRKNIPQKTRLQRPGSEGKRQTCYFRPQIFFTMPANILKPVSSASSFTSKLN